MQTLRFRLMKSCVKDILNKGCLALPRACQAHLVCRAQSAGWTQQMWRIDLSNANLQKLAVAGFLFQERLELAGTCGMHPPILKPHVPASRRPHSSIHRKLDLTYEDLTFMKQSSNRMTASTPCRFQKVRGLGFSNLHLQSLHRCAAAGGSWAGWPTGG